MNKPYIYRDKAPRTFSSESFLMELYRTSNLNFVFSARQGLDLFYKNIYNNRGKCNVSVSPLTCFEALYPIINNNHNIVFVDIDPDTYNMNEEKIPENVQIIQAIHFGGSPQRMDILKQKAKERKALLVEDCAQAFGSTYKNKPMGTFGDFAAFSLLKNIHATGGGFIISNQEIVLPEMKEISIKVSLYRYLKRELESRSTSNISLSSFLLGILVSFKPESVKQVFSSNSINKEIYQSIKKQLYNTELLLSKRKKVATILINEINNENFIPQKVVTGGESSYTRLLYKVKTKEAKYYINALQKFNIGANHLSQSYTSSFQDNIYNTTDFVNFADKEKLPIYNQLHDEIISIPVSPALTQKEIKYISQKINNL